MTLRTVVQQWVQGTLGCHCEAAVFDRIEVSRGMSGLVEPRLELVIGQRLLVQVRVVDATESLAVLSTALAAVGPVEVDPVPAVPAANPTTADPAGQRSPLSLKKRGMS